MNVNKKIASKNYPPFVDDFLFQGKMSFFETLYSERLERKAKNNQMSMKENILGTYITQIESILLFLSKIILNISAWNKINYKLPHSIKGCRIKMLLTEADLEKSALIDT